MFEKLFLLVKSNANDAVYNNPGIPASQSNAVINDASSSIIEVLKKQLDSGRIKDLVKFFQLQDVTQTAILTSVINRFSNKLNKFYNIDPRLAFTISTTLMVPAMQQMIDSANQPDSEFSLQNMLSKLSGGADLSALLSNYIAA